MKQAVIALILEMKEHREVNQPAQVCTVGWVLEIGAPPPPSQRHNFILQVRRLPHREVKGQRRCHTERERGRREPGNKKIGIFSFPRRKRLAFLQGTNVIAKSSKNKPKKTQKPQGPSREFWRKSASKKGYLWERGHCDPETQAPSPRSGWNPWE